MVCLPGKVIDIASGMFLLQSQLTFVAKFHLAWNVLRTLFLSLSFLWITIKGSRLLKKNYNF